jgi:hypothetical protein
LVLSTSVKDLVNGGIPKGKSQTGLAPKKIEKKDKKSFGIAVFGFLSLQSVDFSQPLQRGAVDVVREVICEGVEGFLDRPVVADVPGCGPEAGEEGAAEGIFGEHAVEVAAHDPAVLSDSPFGLAAYGEERAGAVGAVRAAEVDFVAFDLRA